VTLAALGTPAAVEVIELREIAVDITNNLLTGFPNASLRGVTRAVTGADGLIVVTPVFAASYSGLFKSFFDVVEEDALADMPVLLAATGGTERHSLVLEHQMRPLFAYLRTVVVPTSVFAASIDWGENDKREGTLQRRVERAAAELARLVVDRPGGSTSDDLVSAPFEDLLLHR